MSMERLPAFEVVVNGFVCIVFAATAAKAKWMAVSGYWDTYGPECRGKVRKRVWPEVNCCRAYWHDSHPLACHGPKYYSPGYVGESQHAELLASRAINDTLTAELATAREDARTAEAQALKGEEKG